MNIVNKPDLFLTFSADKLNNSYVDRDRQSFVLNEVKFVKITHSRNCVSIDLQKTSVDLGIKEFESYQGEEDIPLLCIETDYKSQLPNLTDAVIFFTPTTQHSPGENILFVDENSWFAGAFFPTVQGWNFLPYRGQSSNNVSQAYLNSISIIGKIVGCQMSFD
ncbi:hypothetical protein R6242_16320 [Iodobacter sp. CM08]|uniref:hypothetical protein n=1 Tax=Iodobacter sp. CM08 TaxID=3085902 RepID=UPI00298235EC|nr:hypothetical protein [Iodobacter sp. CM08]MDW5418132.1 hypothetical protein [Iodobacter sp. CM08]